MSRQIAVHIFLMLLCTAFSDRRELQLHQSCHKTEAISITEFKSGWEEKDYVVTVLDSLHAFKQHFEARAWKNPVDQAGTKTDLPLEGAIRLSSLLDATLFYHGGYIKSSRYGGGVSDIDFTRNEDAITGPSYFVFENAFAAGHYGKKAAKYVKAVEANGGMSEIGYILIMELKISQPQNCFGLVPDWQFLEKIAELDQANKTAFIEAACGKDCGFIAINWNKAGKAGSGLLPYEFRLLPASVVQCKISLNKVIAVKDNPETHKFVEIFSNSSVAQKALNLYIELRDEYHSSNMNRQSRSKNIEEQFKDYSEHLHEKYNRGKIS